MQELIIKADQKNRVSIGPNARKRLGNEYYRVVLPNEIVFKPVPKSALADVRKELRRKWPKGKSIAQVRKEALVAAVEQAME